MKGWSGAMHRIVLQAMLAVFLGANAAGEVSSVSVSGFTTSNKINIKEDPDSTFRALTGYVARWWDPAHTYSGDSSNLSIDAVPGGCFCEALPGGGGVLHLTVAFTSPGRMLRLTGALGPLQGSGLAGSMTWNLEKAGGSTDLEITYSVGGHYEGDLGEIAKAVDSVLYGQALRLKAYIETSRPGPDGSQR